jgi:DNA-binding PadR family transcriptional regulator
MRRYYYGITKAGQEALQEQSKEWQMFMSKLQVVLAGVELP